MMYRKLIDRTIWPKNYNYHQNYVKVAVKQYPLGVVGLISRIRRALNLPWAYDVRVEYEFKEPIKLNPGQSIYLVYTGNGPYCGVFIFTEDS